MNYRVAVLGPGSWGTALAQVLAENGHDVRIWGHRASQVEEINTQHTNQRYLPDHHLPDSIRAFTDMEVKDADAVLFVIPTKAIRSVAKELVAKLNTKPVIIHASKGLEQGTHKRISEILLEEIPTEKRKAVVVLSGPSHAEEVGRKLPTTCVIGAKTKKTAEYLQSAFINKVFRVYTSPDILGIELGGSLKNVIALAAGIADGLGYGDNTKAALITRGIAEIARLGVKMGGKIETFTGLTGIGDLIVTCASVHSRNRKAGYLIGQGRSMQEAMDEVQMVVEGVYSAKAAAKLAKKYDVPMPIVEEVNKVLFEGKSPAEAVDDLMLRESRSEHRALQWEK